MGQPLDLKATLNLPKTGFGMKANLPQNEPKMLARWEEMRIYERIREARKGSEIYVLHDGPPYVNGEIHLGHALNKSLKDFVVKSKTMAGYDAPYVPGWDCHGLPIEIKVDEMLGRKKLEMKPAQVRDACRKYAEKFIGIQGDQFKRLAVFGQWDQPYSTMSPQYEAAVIRNVYSFLDNGLVYKGLRPVLWCINDRTALAEAEVEYQDHTSPSIWVRYALISDPAKIDPKLAGKKVWTIIWTTTPWTLPASMAVAFHPKLEYVALEHEGNVYVVAEALAAQTNDKCKLEGARELARFSGTRMERVTFKHPFLNRSILGVLAEYVTTDQGTGAVHTAPSHGADDFYTGAKYGLDQTTKVDEAGRMRHGIPEIEGKTVFESNDIIVEIVRQHGALMHIEKIGHSYPHCWRCHKPVIFRATEQWFIAMDEAYGPGPATAGDDKSRTLRQRALREIDKVKWDPGWGYSRISKMVSGRPDWCISRQRVWGVPIAVFFCSCGELLRSKEAAHAVIDLFACEGADAWYSREPHEILPKGTKCAKCGGSDFRKEMDILDVWFESGSSHSAVLGHTPDLPWPSDLYLEGGDQHRGWFQSSLLVATGTRLASPYRMTMTCGWTLDEQGRAMSKSLGIGVDPVDIAKRLGAEIVRMWVASVDFREDVVGSERIMQRIADDYRKVRNTFRYILGNLADFEPERDALPFDQMQPLDQYMLLRLVDVSEQVRDWYESFEFHRIYHALHDFCAVDLSAIYFDVLKDRLYTAAADSPARRSAQTAIWRIGEALVRLYSVFMSFTADEVWQNLPRVTHRPQSVHLAHFLKSEEIVQPMLAGDEMKELREEWDTLMQVRDVALKALEEARQAKVIGSGLEAQVTLHAPKSLLDLLHKHEHDLRYLFIVSLVRIVETHVADGIGALRAEIAKAPGQKCERCWNYSVHVGENAEYPTICERCSDAIGQITAGARA